MSDGRQSRRTILSVAYPFAKLGPNAVGGAEQVLTTLESALVARGFQSVVAADARSQVSGTLVGVEVPAGLLTDEKRVEVEERLQDSIDEKNLHMALDAARMAGISVILAGQVFPYPEHVRYFEQQIVPRLGRGARFVVPVGGKAKQRLLARARCLLLPTLAEETSSLVAMEALASGTPVVALPSGAIPEIVEEGRTGFLVRDMQEMAARLKNLNEIDPAACRSVAMKRFSAQAMVERYVSHYASLLR